MKLWGKLILLTVMIRGNPSCVVLHSTCVISPMAGSSSPEFESWEIYAYLVRANFPRLSFESMNFPWPARYNVGFSDIGKH
jgi:hypothetical protein